MSDYAKFAKLPRVILLMVIKNHSPKSPYDLEAILN